MSEIYSNASPHKYGNVTCVCVCVCATEPDPCVRVPVALMNVNFIYPGFRSVE